LKKVIFILLGFPIKTEKELGKRLLGIYALARRLAKKLIVTRRRGRRRGSRRHLWSATFLGAGTASSPKVQFLWGKAKKKKLSAGGIIGALIRAPVSQVQYKSSELERLRFFNNLMN